VKDGRAAGFGAQHCSISLFHSGSQKLGMEGLSVLFTMPPACRGRERERERDQPQTT